MKWVFIFTIIGGIFGFIVHIVWHISLGIHVFTSGSHIIQGLLYTVAGMIIGVFSSWLFRKTH